MIRKKLLYVARPQAGGMTKHLRTLLAHFSRQWDVFFAAPSALLTPVNENGSAVKYIQILLPGHAAPFRDIGVLLRLAKICRDEKIDLLHVHGYKAGIVTLPAAKICGCPVLMTIHNSLLYPAKSIVPESYFYRAIKGLDPLVSGYIVVSDALRQELLGWGIHPTKIVKIYNGINCSEFTANMQNRQGFGEKGKVEWEMLKVYPGLKIGTAARLIFHKGVDIFIRAAARIASRYPDLIFFIAGEGPERDKLESLRDLLGMEDKIYFLGDIRQMPAFLSCLDIFVLASRTEGLSISLLEAGSVGLPRVASAVGGIPEIVEHGKTGILVPAEDVVSLVKAISCLIEEPQSRKNLGQEASKEIRLRFSEETMLNETGKVYEEILKGKTRSAVTHG